jgi:hypothetical protein
LTQASSPSTRIRFQEDEDSCKKEHRRRPGAGKGSSELEGSEGFEDSGKPWQPEAKDIPTTIETPHVPATPSLSQAMPVSKERSATGESIMGQAKYMLRYLLVGRSKSQGGQPKPDEPGRLIHEALQAGLVPSRPPPPPTPLTSACSPSLIGEGFGFNGVQQPTTPILAHPPAVASPSRFDVVQAFHSKQENTLSGVPPQRPPPISPCLGPANSNPLPRCTIVDRSNVNQPSQASLVGRHRSMSALGAQASGEERGSNSSSEGDAAAAAAVSAARVAAPPIVTRAAFSAFPKPSKLVMELDLDEDCSWEGEAEADVPTAVLLRPDPTATLISEPLFLPPGLVKRAALRDHLLQPERGDATAGAGWSRVSELPGTISAPPYL